MKNKKMLTIIIVLLVVILAGYSVSKFTDNPSKPPITKEFKTALFDQIKIDSSTDSVTFVEGKHYCVSYIGQKKWLPVVKVKNGALILQMIVFTLST